MSIAIPTAKAIGVKIIAALAQRLVSSGLYDRIIDLVQDAVAAISGPGTGAQKKDWVINRLKQEDGWLMAEIEELPGWLLSMVIDIAVGRLKLDGKL